MAVVDPEAIHAALYARLGGIAALPATAFKARRYVTWADVPKEKQPSMIVCSHSASAQRQLGLSTIWTFLAEAVFYVRDPNDKALTVETTLHEILQQVDAALLKQAGELAPDDNPDTTLGLPYVWRCFRRDHAVHHSIEAGQSALSMVIEIVAVETA